MKHNPLIEYAWQPLLFMAIVAFLLIDPLGIITAQVMAQTRDGDLLPDKDVFAPIVKLLSMIFILAVLVEVALSVLFRWRIFLRYFDSIGLKVPIAFAVSLAIVIANEIDLPGDVIEAFGTTPTAGKEVGYFIGALIIAGGSSSVNAVFEKLGWRNPVAQKEKAEKDKQNRSA